MMMQQQQQQHHGNGSSDRGSALEPSEPPEEDFNQQPKEDASDTPAADDENRKDCITIAMANGRHPTSYADAVMNGSILDTPMTNLAMDSPASKQQQQQQHSALPTSPHDHLDQQVQVHLSQEQQYHQQHHDYHLQEHHCQHQPHHNTYGYGASPSSPHAALGQPSTPASPSILPQCYPQQSEEAKESHHQLNHTDQSSTQYQTTHNPYSASSQTGGEGTEEKIPQTNYAAINSNGCPHGISVNQYHGDDGDSNNDGRMSVVSERAMSIVSERATTPMVMSTMAEDDFMIQDVLYEDTNNMNNKGGEAADVIHGGNADEASSPESGIETENEQSRKQSQNTESTGAIDEQCRNTEGIGGVNISPNNSEYTRITQPTASTTQTNNTPNSDNGSNTAADTGMGATLAVQAQREADKYSTPGTTAMKQRPTLLSKELLRSPEHTIDRLSYILGRGTLVMVRWIMFSRGTWDHGRLLWSTSTIRVLWNLQLLDFLIYFASHPHCHNLLFLFHLGRSIFLNVVSGTEMPNSLDPPSLPTHSWEFSSLDTTTLVI